MRLARRGARRPRVEILPLIDVIFLLLIFFIYAMLTMTVRRGLDVQLPVSDIAPASNQAEEHLLIRVTADRRVILNGAPVRLQDLSQRLRASQGSRSYGQAEKKAVRNSRPPAVRLLADRSLPYQELFVVLDAVRRAGINRIALQACAPKDGGSGDGGS